jgi:hypothetical protein
LDTGPLVADLSEAQDQLTWARERFDRFTEPVIPGEAVRGEAAPLFRHRRSAADCLRAFLR